MKETLQESFLSFKESVKTLHLSTLTEEGKPNASYAPYVAGQLEGDQGSFYIFVSQLASHTQDLLSNPETSILLMQDESSTRQIFARRRLSYQCFVEIVQGTEPGYNINMDALEARFGNVVTVLRGLPDFILFRLKPYKGQYVMGFGKAYKLTGETLLELEHINPQKS